MLGSLGQQEGKIWFSQHSQTLPPNETRRYIGKYSLYWSSETTNQKYNFAFKNLPSQAKDTTIDNTLPPPDPLENSQTWDQPTSQKRKADYPQLREACAPNG
jgi:hypothetical protein